MENLKFFDGNCTLGRKTKKEVWEINFDAAGDLKQEMDYYNITDALVYHLTSKDYDPKIGNERLLEEIKGYNCIHAQWVLTPDVIWEAGDIKVYIRDMLQKGVRAVRMFPKTHGFLLNDRTCGALLEEFKTHQIPLFIDLEEISWKELDYFLERHPDSPLVVTRLSSWGDDRYFYPLLRDFKKLYLETSFYRIMGGLEAIRDRFGADRLIFGSGLPDLAAGAPLSMILYSELSEKEKQRLAYANIRDLLGGVKL